MALAAGDRVRHRAVGWLSHGIVTSASMRADEYFALVEPYQSGYTLAEFLLDANAAPDDAFALVCWDASYSPRHPLGFAVLVRPEDLEIVDAHDRWAIN